MYGTKLISMRAHSTLTEVQIFISIQRNLMFKLR